MIKALALVGNPNVGKTAVFNDLTGLSHSTGNYPGVTVERKHGELREHGIDAEIVDMPGAYSLAARSPDEMIVADILLNQVPHEHPVIGLVVVVDASNLERNLYFVSQLLELGKPIIIALNMMDVAARLGVIIDLEALSREIGAPVVPLCAHIGKGVDALLREIRRMVEGHIPPAQPVCRFPECLSKAVDSLTADLEQFKTTLGRTVPRAEAFRVLVDEEGYAEERLVRTLGEQCANLIRARRREAQSGEITLAATEARERYRWAEEVTRRTLRLPSERPVTGSDRLDDVLTHRVLGTLCFLGIMMLVFQSIYSGALPAMHAVEAMVGWVGTAVGGTLPSGMLRSLVVDGIIGGVGSVVVFLPQILLLSLFIAILEDCGYMARAAFLMDKIMSWCGLSGQSFIPMLSCFACAVPGITATRVIHNQRDRFATILVAPLMSCSARLLVYTVMIAALIPERRFLGGIIGLQGLTLFCAYILGIAVTGPAAWIFKRTIFRGQKSPFIMEMPSYKMPQPRSVIRKLYREGREFLVRAGTLIFSVAVIVWALAYFPHSATIEEEFEVQRAETMAHMPEGPERDKALQEIDHKEAGAHLRNSFLGRLGRMVEPVFRPMGWDWRIATAVIASFPAREVFIATLATILNLEYEDDSAYQVLSQRLKAVERSDGEKLFNIPVGLSIIVFFALCCQCAATLFVIRRETAQWRWSILTFSYMTTLAYLGALITYQGFTLLGL